MFRALKALEECGLVHHLVFAGGYYLCRLPEDRGCHHHLICSECGQVSELDCEGMVDVQAAAACVSGYRLESHYVEFVGRCRDCQ